MATWLAVKSSPPLRAGAAAAALLLGCGDGGGNGPGQAGDVEFIDLRAEEVAATSAVIRFRTSRPTTCQAEYDLQETSLDRSATDPAMGSEAFAYDHRVPLEDLAPATLYYYRARATDEAGRTYRSAVLQFTTAAAEGATQLVNFSLPAQGTTVAGVSSQFGGGDSAWGASRAVDGQMAAEWSSDGDGDGAWIALDFGQERLLTRFEFRSRQMADGTAIITRLRLIFDGGRQLGPFDTPDPGQVYGFDFAEPVRTRTARLEAVASTGGNTGAREIRFLGPAP